MAVDSAQIEQSLLNLYINASEAMPKGGKIFIETENVILGKRAVQKWGIKPGEYVKVSVADVGIGIDKKDLHRIFEPFFTTKKFRLKNIDPNVRVVLSSGYSLQGQAHDIFKSDGVGFLQKPFSEKELLQEMSTVLGL